MKDSRATSWLNMGASAVRAGDKADARFYLERALNSDPDLEDETQIWYWLSRITDDPAEKRRLLQDVVISEPGHAEARRELAILEGRLNPEAIRDPREDGEASGRGEQRRPPLYLPAVRRPAGLRRRQGRPGLRLLRPRDHHVPGAGW